MVALGAGLLLCCGVGLAALLVTSFFSYGRPRDQNVYPARPRNQNIYPGRSADPIFPPPGSPDRNLGRPRDQNLHP